MSTVYELRKNDCGDIAPCERCYSEVPTGEFGDDGFMCKFCAGTLLGNVIADSRSELGTLARGIVQALHILDKGQP